MHILLVRVKRGLRVLMAQIASDRRAYQLMMCLEDQLIVSYSPDSATASPPPSATSGPPPPASSGDSTVPVQVKSNFQVKLSLYLNISLADFTSSMQQSLREQMAITAGLSKADVSRVQLDVRTARRRRLLASTAGGVAVDVTVNMPDAASASKATSLLSQSAVASALSLAGLPTATVTSPPAMTGSGAALQQGSRLVLGMLAVLVTLATFAAGGAGK